ARVARLPRGAHHASAPARGTRPPPHRRGTVQGGGARAARRGRARSAVGRCAIPEGSPVSRTVIVTPFGRPDQLAAACVLSEIEGDVVPLGDFSAIVQHGTDIAAGNRAAAAISKLTGKHEVLLMVRSEDQIDAAHYRGGER